MPATLPEYEVFALRYATRDALRRDHFIGGDPHDGPMPMDYFVWAAVGPAGAYVIDTGFTTEMAKERKRTFLRCPTHSLALLGIEARAARGRAGGGGRHPRGGVAPCPPPPPPL